MQLGKHDQVAILESATRTADSNSSPVDVQYVNDLVLYLDVTDGNADGDETLDITIQDSPDQGTWHDVASFTQVNASTATERLVLGEVGSYIRAVVTLAGTTPSYTFELQAVGKN